jgi:hypothetical protein
MKFDTLLKEYINEINNNLQKIMVNGAIPQETLFQEYMFDAIKKNETNYNEMTVEEILNDIRFLINNYAMEDGKGNLSIIKNAIKTPIGIQIKLGEPNNVTIFYDKDDISEKVKIYLTGKKEKEYVNWYIANHVKTK